MNTYGADPAYPVEYRNHEKAFGTTKKELMATMILAGLMANPERYKYSVNLLADGLTQDEVSKKNAKKAVKLAEALISALNESQSSTPSW